MFANPLTLFKNVIEQNNNIKKPDGYINFVQEQVFRPLSVIPSVIFLWLGIGANMVSFIRLNFFLLACLLFVYSPAEYIYYVTTFYLFSEILDYSDGTVARYNKTASEFGAFLDGFTDFYNCFVFICIPFINQSLGKSFINFQIDFLIAIVATLATASYIFFTVRLSLTVRLLKANDPKNQSNAPTTVSKKQQGTIQLYSALQSFSPILLVIAVAANQLFYFYLYLIVFKIIFLQIEVAIQIKRYKKIMVNA